MHQTYVRPLGLSGYVDNGPHSYDVKVTCSGERFPTSWTLIMQRLVSQHKTACHRAVTEHILMMSKSRALGEQFRNHSLELESENRVHYINHIRPYERWV